MITHRRADHACFGAIQIAQYIDRFADHGLVQDRRVLAGHRLLDNLS